MFFACTTRFFIVNFLRAYHIFITLEKFLQAYNSLFIMNFCERITFLLRLKSFLRRIIRPSKNDGRTEYVILLYFTLYLR